MSKQRATRKRAEATTEQAATKLGLSGRTLTPALAQQLGIAQTKGVVVEQVEEGGRAQNAGITTEGENRSCCVSLQRAGRTGRRAHAD